MKCLSLFSGIGGFDLAFRNLGHQIVGACEIDKYARQVYSRHFPGIKIWNDATKLKPEELPDFDLLCAGFPCQSFSTAGRRKGFEDARGTMFFEIARIAEHKRPKILLLENVKGLLSNDGGKTFWRILETLDEIGYNAEWQTINSKYFLPHQRERVFIIATIGTEPRSKILPIRENDSQVIEHDKVGMIMMSNTKANIKQRLQERETSWCLDTSDSYFAVLTPNNFAHKAGDGTATRKHDVKAIIPALQATEGHNQASYVLRERLARKLTPLERERLQGFPDDWTKNIPEKERVRCLGNAVNVPTVEFIIRQFNNRQDR